MARTRAELKAELEGEAARLIEDMLTWNEQAGSPSLTEIEDQALRFRKALGERLAQALVEAQPSVEPVLVGCPTCGRKRNADGGTKRAKRSRWAMARPGSGTW
jgi:hypothetical protein